MLRPLTELLKQGREFTWGADQDTAMDEFKSRIEDGHALAHPDLNQSWTLETDASNKGIGGVLFQGEGEEKKIVSFFSHTFNETQARWPTYEQELYGIVYCLTRPDLAPLFRAHTRLLIRTDHRNLIYLMNRVEASKKLLRWIMLLSDYSYTIEHVAGADNHTADCLSRMTHACAAVTTAPHTWGTLKERIKASQNEHKDSIKWDQSFCNVDGLILTHGIPAIPPPDTELQAIVMEAAHGDHLGRNETLRRAQEQGRWPGMAEDVRKHVEACTICRKTRHKRLVKALQMTTAVSEIWNTIAIDTIGPLPADVTGCKYIVVATDLFSRYTELYPAPENTARAAADAIWLLVTRHGMPRYIKSDNGPEYVNKVVESLLATLQINHQRTIPYHPESNGVVERKNAEVMRHLRWLTLVASSFDRWSQYMPMVQSIVNNTVHSATSFTPHEMLYGRAREASLATMLAVKRSDAAVSPADFVQRAGELAEQVRAWASKQQDTVVAERRRKANDNVTEPNIQVGDYVLVDSPRANKLHGLRGPFIIKKILAKKAVTIVSVLGDEELTTHLDKLMIIDPHESIETLRALAASDREHYIVEDVIDHRKMKGKRELLIRWEGYEEPTWEPVAALKHLPVARAYLKSASWK